MRGQGGVVDVRVSKNRNGATGTSSLRFFDIDEINTQQEMNA